MLMIVFGALLASFLMGVLIIRFQHVHAKFTADHDLDGVQKFHATPVPRIGGVPVMTGIVAGACVASFKWPNIEMWLLLASSLPAYLAGLTEDVTKRIGPLPRLLATFVAALLGFWLLKAGLNRLAIPGLDTVLERYWFLSLLFTIVAVGGVAHAINIIDGYNGLAGMVSIFIFLALAYVSFKVGDTSLLGLSLAAAGGVAGFLLWNFPRGLIFAGDGGAYLIGFLIAEISVLLVARHPQVSPWFPLLLVIYPVFETLFSIYRRKFLQGRSVGYPDALHLHQMVYKRLVRWMVGSREARHLTDRNSLTSPYLWTLTSLAVVPAMLFWDNTIALLGFTILFVLAYVGLYRMIIRFQTPGWMVLRKRRKH